MKTVPFGNTGRTVSACCLGLMNLGSRVDEVTSKSIMDAYWDAGGRFLDTANVYTLWNEGGKAGDSESLLGRWLKERGNRNGLFIATKVGLGYEEVPEGLKASTIERECEKSLKRMGIGTIDLYYSHRDDRKTPLEETLEACERLVRAGKVRFTGASNHAAWRLAEARCMSEARGWTAYTCVQQRFTYLRVNPAGAFSDRVETDKGLLDYCRVKNVPLVAFSPLLKGAYAQPDKEIPREYLGADTDARLAELKAVSTETGATANQVIIAWMLALDAPVIPLFSASKLEQIRENLRALEITLTPEQIARLTNAGQAGNV